MVCEGPRHCGRAPMWHGFAYDPSKPLSKTVAGRPWRGGHAKLDVPANRVAKSVASPWRGKNRGQKKGLGFRLWGLAPPPPPPPKTSQSPVENQALPLDHCAICLRPEQRYFHLLHWNLGAFATLGHALIGFVKIHVREAKRQCQNRPFREP